jgi:hypothetical protein
VSLVDTYQLVQSPQSQTDVFLDESATPDVTAQPVSIDRPTVLAAAKPAGMSAAGWSLVLNNLEANVGTTFPQLQATFDQDATYLSTLGEHVSSYEDLLGFELERAEGFGSIVRASTLGPLGDGQFTEADLTTTADNSGDVTISQDGVTAFFELEPDSS